MTVVGEAVVQVRPNLSPFKRDVEQGVARTKIKPVKVKADSRAFSSSLAPLKRAVLGLGAVFAGVKVAGFFKDSVTAASDLNESLSKTRVVFGASSKEVERFARTSATSLGLSRQAALEASATLGNLFVALKIGKAPAADMSTTMVKLAGDLASFNNVKPEEALEALRSGLVGETEPLRKFGVNLNDATLRQKALDLGLVKSTKDVLPPAAKAQAAYALILEQTKTAQGDFARTSGGLANQQRILTAQITNLKARLGGALLPVVTAAISKFNEWLPTILHVSSEIANFAKRIAGAKDWKARISIVWDKITEAKAALGKLLFGSDIFKGQQTIHLPGLVDNLRNSIAQIDWSSVGAAISTGLSAGIAAVKPVASDMGKRIDEAVTAIRARIPQFANLGAELLATIFVTLTDPGFWAAHWQLAAGVALAVIPVGKFLKAGEVILEVLARPFAKLGAKLVVVVVRELGKVLKAIEGYSPRLAKIVGNLLESAGEKGAQLAKSGFKKIEKAVTEALSKVPTLVRIAFRAIINLGIVQTAVDAFNAAVRFGKRIVAGAKSGVGGLVTAVTTFIAKIPGAIVTYVQFVYNSAVALGKAMVEGAVAGVKSLPGALANALGNLARDAISKAKGIIGAKSPSKLTRDVLGKPMVEGIIVGVRALSGQLKDALSQSVKDAVVGAKQNLSSLSGSLSSSLNSLLDAKLGGGAAATSLGAAQQRANDLDFQRQVADLTATLNDAATSQEDRAKAQADLDVLNAQRSFDLEQAKVDAAKAGNDRQLADLADALNRGLITQAQYQAKVKALLASQGADYQSAGDALGLAFADGFLAQLRDMITQSVQIAKAGLPNLNELLGNTTNPAAAAREDLGTAKDTLSQAKADLRDRTHDARQKSGDGGAKITKAEQAAIDSAKRREDKAQKQVDLLTQLVAAISSTPPPSIIISDPAGLAKALGLQVTQAAR